MKIRYSKPNDPTNFYDLKVGWSWTLFFFWQTFGIPFFFRKMPLYAAAAIGYNIVSGYLQAQAPNLIFTFAVLNLGVSIYLGIKGNELTRDFLLKNGYVPETQEQFTRRSGFAMNPHISG